MNNIRNTLESKPELYYTYCDIGFSIYFAKLSAECIESPLSITFETSDPGSESRIIRIIQSIEENGVPLISKKGLKAVTKNAFFGFVHSHSESNDISHMMVGKIIKVGNKNIPSYLALNGEAYIHQILARDRSRYCDKTRVMLYNGASYYYCQDQSDRLNGLLNMVRDRWAYFPEKGRVKVAGLHSKKSDAARAYESDVDMPASAIG